MNLPALKSAYFAISPTPATLSDAVTILNAQNTTVAVQVKIQDIAAYLALYQDLGALINFANNPPSGASVTSINAATALVFMLQHATAFPPFDMTNSTVATKLEGFLSALVNPGAGITGPITETDQTNILALASKTVPVWNPGVTVGDLQTALAIGN